MHTFVAFAPDKTAAGTFELRMSVRPAHLERLKKLYKDGVLKTGGAMHTPETIDSDAKHFTGSVFWLETDSLASARTIVEEDVYFTAGVWDPEKLVVLPFATPSQNPPPQ